MKRLLPVFLLVLCAVLLTNTLSAQRITGQIFGKVTDDQGAPLPGVSIQAKGPRLVGEAVTVTNELGVYRLVALPPGAYNVKYTLAGFQPLVREEIVVGAEVTVTLDVTLSASTIEEQVTVVGQTPLIDVKSTARGATMNRQVFTLLPKGRNFDSLLVTVPGVTNEPLLAGTSVDGASGAENMWYVDGISTTNLINGTSAQGVNFDFVEEVSFKSSGYNAEYGGSLGGVVNVLTRSGGNAFHGEVLAYYSDEALMGRRRDVLAYNNKDTARNQSASYYAWDRYYGSQKWYNVEAGFNLGGYILRDRIWFFVSAIPNFNRYTRTLDYAIQGLATPVPPRDVHRKEIDWNGQVKISAQPMKNLRVSAGLINNMSIVRGCATGLPSSWNGSTTLDYDDYDFNYPNMSASVTADWIVTSSLMVSVRGGFFRTNQNHQDPLPTGPYYGFFMEQPFSYAQTTNVDLLDVPVEFQHGPGWQNFPVQNVNDFKKVIRQKFNANLDLTYFANLGGEHAFKFGGQYIRQGEDRDDRAPYPIVYLAWDEELDAYGTNYGRGTYGWYAVRGNAITGTYGNFFKASSDQWALYAQDSWTIARKLTVNAGIRAESEYVPSYSTDPEYANLRPIRFPFSKKISPRLGFVYDVLGDSSLKVYGSFAIYQDVMKLDLAANAFGGNHWLSTYYTLDTYDFTQFGVDNYYPGTNLVTFDFRPVAFDLVDPDMRPFTQREIALGVDKKISENLSVSLRVVNKSVLYAIEDMGVVVPGIGEVYYYGNPGFDFINDKYHDAIEAGILPEGVPDMPEAKREYWAVNFSLDKRLSNNWLLGFSATWSSLKGNYSGLANSDEQGRNNPNGERSFDIWHFQFDKQLNPIGGVLPTDRPLMFKAYASYVFPMGLTVGAVAQAMSGTPLTTAWNVDGPGYYPFNRGNLGRTPFLFYADAYAEYNMRLGGRYGLQFSVNLSNMFNVETATNFTQTVYRTNITPGDDALLSGEWEPSPTARLDGRFMYANTFFAPFQARFGMKFSF